MFRRILNRMRERVRRGQYLMTLHAEEEMSSDSLTVFDVENGILTGEILERQLDPVTAEWKYRIRGLSISGQEVEVVAKIGPTDMLSHDYYLYAR